MNHPPSIARQISMTQHDPAGPTPLTETVTEPPDGATEPAPTPPEPWTAERVSEWNAYYDLYVTFGVLLLVFIASANKIAHSTIWTQLQTGRLIAATGAPVLKDPFSYTEAGVRWVNVPWLFDWSHAAVFKAASDLAPANVANPLLSSARAEQFGAGALVALNALARMLTALLLLGVRRGGPGRWWSAVCVTLAMGVVMNPGGLTLGGIALPALVSPGNWGLLFLAAEVLLIYRGFTLGRRGAVYALVPLFVLWANTDDSFLTGLLVLAATALGRVRPAADEPTGAPGARTALAVLVVSALGCLLNPSTVHVYRAAAEPYLGLFRPSTDVATVDQLSYFGKAIRQPNQVGGAWVWLATYYGVIVSLGLASFLLNRRRFSPARFLVYALGAVLWALFIRLGAEFAVIFAATLALNGQEWYHDEFGAGGRLGARWAFWSVGGRAVTIVVVFTCVAMALTGWGKSYGDSRFGFGFDPDDFAFEAADLLKSAPLQGNVLNTTLAQGDALVWRAFPERKVFRDGRQHLFPAAVLNQLREIQRALSSDDEEAWRPLLDRHAISTVMIQPSHSPNTYRALSQSPNWVPFHDDGSVVLFGRADAPETDLAFFKANRLEPEALAYHRTKLAPAPEGPPSPVGWMESIFQTRALTPPQPHTIAARRWLYGLDSDSAVAGMPDPARCLLAIREARTALASKPDDTQAFRLLAAAYRALTIQEATLLSGLEITPENVAAIGENVPRPDRQMTRFRERATALNYAIQTTPPPKTRAARQELQSLNLQLFQQFIAANFLDLARDRLKAVLDSSLPGDFASADSRARLAQDLAQLDERVKAADDRIKELELEQQGSPSQLASFAISQGAPGLAIRVLKEAERTGANPAQVKPQLLDLYCDTGQPEEAIDILNTGSSVEDPAFGAEPGIAAMRQARAYFLLGNGENAATLWEKYAIPRLRDDRAKRALGAAQILLKGEAKVATNVMLDIPEKIGQQASWEYEAGLCRLEAGTPDIAAEHFSRALTLAPKMNSRPILVYYLEKLGKAVPPIPTGAERPAPAMPADATKPAETGKPANPPKTETTAPR